MTEESTPLGDACSGDATSSGADCAETVHRLYHFLDGELTEERRAAIRGHLNKCSPCEQIVSFEAELRRARHPGLPHDGLVGAAQ